MMHNVGTTHAIKRAVIDGEPLIQRVVTVTGQTFKQPGNTWALLGTPVNFLLERFDYKADKKLPRVIMGGPMMGFTLPHCDVPITKIANCILAPTRKEISPTNHEMSCIRCTACAEACPVSCCHNSYSGTQKIRTLPSVKNTTCLTVLSVVPVPMSALVKSR